MLQRATLVLFVLITSAATLHAEEPDAQTRYHEAYVLEVVEGKVAKAAKVYLALMRDEAIPAQVRHESRFRFAMCAVILGRADEARAQLTKLLGDRTAPASLRVRAEEYRKAISGVGVGTELGRKLQALVFDLGRASPTDHVPAYRDFEIIGKAAIPFLHKLLNHEDRKLRQHAFRLLCRLDDPRTIEFWTPDVNINHGLGSVDFSEYRKRDAKRQAAFEKRLFELGEPAIAAITRTQYPRRYSIDFVKKLAALGKWPRAAAGMVKPWGDEADARWQLLHDWSRGEDKDLAHHALVQIIEYGAHEKAGAGEAEFKQLMRYLLARVQFKRPDLRVDNLEGLANSWAKFASSQAVFEIIDETLGVSGDEALAAHQRGYATKLRAGLNAALHEREVAQVDQAAMARVVRAEFKLAAKRSTLPGRHFLPWNGLRVRIVRLLEHLPMADAELLVRDIYSGPAHGRVVAGHWMSMFTGVRGERGIRLMLAALRAGVPEGSVNLIEQLPGRQGDVTDEPAIRTLHASLPALAEDLEPGQLEPIIGRAVEFLRWLPEQEAREAWVDLLVLGETLDPARARGMRKFLLGNRLPPALVARVLLPGIGARWASLGKQTRSEIVGRAIHIALTASPVTTEDRKTAASFALAHPAEIPRAWHGQMMARADMFPLERWMPLAPGALTISRRVQLPAEQAQAVAAHLLASPDKLESKHAEFVRTRGSAAQRAELYTRLLRSPDAAQRALGRQDPAMRTRAEEPAEALEASLAIELRQPSADLTALRELGQLLLKIRPSKKLYPVARQLLASSDRVHIDAGIAIAKSLGQEELLPVLRKHLESLDIRIRNAAQDAMESIRALSKLRAETQGAEPRGAEK